MTAILQFLTSTDVVDVVPEITALDRIVNRELNELVKEGGIRMPLSYQKLNEVQTIGQHVGGPTGGTYTLTISTWKGIVATTAAIAYDANAATIEAAIDTAMQAVPGNTHANGDIAVTGGPLTTGDVTLTFSGGSVNDENHDQTTIDGSALVGGTAGAVSTVINGQQDRNSWAILHGTGIVTSTLQPMGVVPPDLQQGSQPISRPLSAASIKALAEQIAADERNAELYTAILDAAGVPR